MPAILEIDGYELVIPLSKINFFSENDSDNDDQNIIYYMIYPKIVYKYISGEFQSEQKDVQLSKGVYHLLVLLKASNPDCIISLNKLEDLSGEEVAQYISQVKSDLTFYPKLKSVTKKFNKLSISSENKSKQSEQTWDHESDSDTDTKLDDDSEESSD